MAWRHSQELTLARSICLMLAVSTHSGWIPDTGQTTLRVRSPHKSCHYTLEQQVYPTLVFRFFRTIGRIHGLGMACRNEARSQLYARGEDSFERAEHQMLKGRCC